MADEGKGVALAILGVVALVAVVGLVLLFWGPSRTGKVTAGADKLYGGSLSDVEFPYLDDRPVKGVPTTPEGIKVAEESVAYAEAVPYRTYNRVPDKIPTTQTTCGEGSFEVSVQFKEQLENTYPDAKCSDYVSSLDAYCCKVPGVKLK